MSADSVVTLGGPAPGAAGARLAELFARHARMVLGVCRLQLRDGVEAEDAAQQTFLSAYRSLLLGTEPRDPAAWLATIARNECRARVRARAQTVELHDETAVAADGPEEAAMRREQMQALYAALVELPERQREAVMLRDVYGLRYGEIGAALGVSRPSVEALLFRARRKLRVRLRPAAAALVVPLALREGVAQAVPGFAAASVGSGAALVGAGGLLAKLGSAPLAAKVVGVTLAAGSAGVVAVESKRGGDAPRPAPPLVVSGTGIPAGPTAPVSEVDEGEGESEPRERGEPTSGRERESEVEDAREDELRERSGAAEPEEEAEQEAAETVEQREEPPAPGEIETAERADDELQIDAALEVGELDVRALEADEPEEEPSRKLQP